MSKGKHTKNNSKKVPVWPFALAAVVIAAALAVWLIAGRGDGSTGPTAEPNRTTPDISAPDEPSPEVTPEAAGEPAAPDVLDGTEVGDGLVIDHAGRYAGMFVEDGSDELVSEVLALTLTNTSGKMLQYAGFSVVCAGETYSFEISSVPAGESVIALELGRKQAPASFQDAAIEVNMLSFFDEEPSLFADMFEISASDYSITVKNISGSDVPGDVYVYYKTVSDGVYMGGITYRANAGSLAAGQEVSAYAGHYLDDSSEILFVTYK